MRESGARAMRIAVLSSAICGILQGLPDQPFKAQLLDLASKCEQEADALGAELEFEEGEPSGIRAA